MLDTSFPHILKREKTLPGTALSLGALELWSDNFEDKGQFCQYLSRLVSFMGIYKVIYIVFSFCLLEKFLLWNILKGIFYVTEFIHNLYLKF